ncbi:MAG: response regulator [Sedimentisphaerales bacterium]
MSKKIIFIEDEAFTVRALANYLRDKKGYEVVLVGITKAAELLSQGVYDLLVLDIMLPHDGIVPQNTPPKTSGIAFAKMLKRGKLGNYDVKQNAKIPIIVLTAVVDPNSIKEIKSLEPSVLLRKPVTWEEFYDAVKNALGTQ